MVTTLLTIALASTCLPDATLLYGVRMTSFSGEQHAIVRFVRRIIT
jgi:hypothetical protein